MLAHPQPIKCLESVMLAIHLTNKRKFHDLDRVPIGFKTVDTVTRHDYRYSATLPCFSYASFWEVVGMPFYGFTMFVCRHVVLGIREKVNGNWGALGLSRDTGLMWKPLAFPSLSALLTDYQDAYSRISHQVLKVRIGLPVPQNEKIARQVTRFAT